MLSVCIDFVFMLNVAALISNCFSFESIERILKCGYKKFMAVIYKRSW
jgi:hypothetical protein